LSAKLFITSLKYNLELFLVLQPPFHHLHVGRFFLIGFRRPDFKDYIKNKWAKTGKVKPPVVSGLVDFTRKILTELTCYNSKGITILKYYKNTIRILAIILISTVCCSENYICTYFLIGLNCSVVGKIDEKTVICQSWCCVHTDV